MRVLEVMSSGGWPTRTLACPVQFCSDSSQHRLSWVVLGVQQPACRANATAIVNLNHKRSRRSISRPQKAPFEINYQAILIPRVVLNTAEPSRQSRLLTQFSFQKQCVPRALIASTTRGILASTSDPFGILLPVWEPPSGPGHPNQAKVAGSLVSPRGEFSGIAIVDVGETGSLVSSRQGVMPHRASIGPSSPSPRSERPTASTTSLIDWTWLDLTQGEWREQGDWGCWGECQGAATTRTVRASWRRAAPASTR